MLKPEICIIAALSGEDGVIGKDGKIPWHIPEDLKRFRKLTTPHPIIMGRNTWESIGRVLPNRLNIVVSRTIAGGDIAPVPETSKIVIARSLDQALEFGSRDNERMFIIGGGEIYRQTMEIADRLFLTVVEGNFEGDTFFPDYSEFRRIVVSEDRMDYGFKYKFLELER